MTPYLLARSVYESEPCARTFEEDLLAHLYTGYVVSTPEVFLMFRLVHSAAHPEQILDPWTIFEGGDCWHVYLAAGDASQFHAHFPQSLQWVSFERKNRLRIRRYRSCASKLAHHGNRRSLLRYLPHRS